VIIKNPTTEARHNNNNNGDNGDKNFSDYVTEK